MTEHRHDRQRAVSVDGTWGLHWLEPDPDAEDSEIRDRFYDIKHAMQARREFEVTNYDVLDTLCELFWVHAEADAPAETQPLVADGGQDVVGSKQNPVDARFCPSCGEELPPGAATLYGDDTFNRYRATFSCPGCGYSGEVIREGGVWPNQFGPDDFLSREQEQDPRTVDGRGGPELRTDGGQPTCDTHPDREASVVEDGEARCDACQIKAVLYAETTPDGPRPRCPRRFEDGSRCASARVHQRQTVRSGDAEGSLWWCKTCGHDFDEPYYRPAQQTLTADGGEPWTE